MAIYAIGDIHGCYNAFRRLLIEINFCPTKDRLWFVGDLVNRGEDNVSVLRWLFDHQDKVTVVLGNHDLHLLTVYYVASDRMKASDTIHDVLDAVDGAVLCDWLRRRPLAHYENNILMVHAGVLPQWNLKQVLSLSSEVSDLIRGEQWPPLAEKLYGDFPNQWNHALVGEARYRLIINALTRMRICSLKGQMNLKFSDAPSQIPRGWFPWFEIPNRETKKIQMVCGHWSALGVMQQNTVWALDSGCLWGGALSAVRLQDGRLYQVAAK